MYPAEHPFYQLSRAGRRRVLWRVALLALAVNAIFGALAIYLGIYFLPVLFISLTLTVIAPFFDVPSMVRRRKMRYFSNLFLVETPSDGALTLHGGTLFDYFFVLDRRQPGLARQRVIIRQYLEGLLNLITAYEDQPGRLVRGTSYVINERTARKLGFRKIKTSSAQSLILAFNYLNLLIANSLAKARPSLPSLSKTHSFEATIADLHAHKERIEDLKNRLTDQASSGAAA